MKKQNRQYYPLTIPQLNMLSAKIVSSWSKYETGVISFYFVVKDVSDPKILEKAFNKLLLENDGLRIRTKFSIKATQYVEDYEYEELETMSFPDFESCKNMMTKLNSTKEISTKNDSKLYRARIMTYENNALLFMKFSHSIFDGYSLILVINKLSQYCLELEQGEEKKSIDEQSSIIEYIESNWKYKHSKAYKKDLAYWTKEFNRHKNIEFPFPKRKLNSPAENTLIQINGNIYKKLNVLSKKISVPISFLVTSAIGCTIYDLTNRKCFAIVPLSHGRIKYNHHKLIGCMNNTFLHFFDYGIEENLIEYIKKNYIEYLDNMMHGNIDASKCFFKGLPKALRKGNMSYFGLVLSVLNLAEIDIDENKFSFSIIEDYNRAANQLYCSINDNHNDKIELSLFYQTKLFSCEDIKKYENILKCNIDKILNAGNI